MSVTTETKWKCIPCAKIFKTVESMDEHKRSKKCKKNTKAYLAKHPEMEASSLFRSITHEVSSDFLSDINKSINKDSEPLKVEEDSENSKTSIPVKTTLESLRICLFSN